MRNLKRLFQVHLFYAFVIMFMTMIFVLNLSFFIFANVHYSREIERQYENLTLMIAHLSRENNVDLTAAYLEHYTHNANVIITFYSSDQLLVFTNDDDSILTSFDEVYDNDRYVGRLSISYESSSFGQEYGLGFVLINLSSLLIFFVGSYTIRQYLLFNQRMIQSDLHHIEDSHVDAHFREMKVIKEKLTHEKDEALQRQHIYTSHIKRLAHDVKTPLTASKMYIDGLISGRIQNQKDALNDVKQELDRIEKIVPQFIEVNQKKLAYPHDISKDIERYISRYQSIFDTKEIQIETIFEPLEVMISEHDMMTLVEHLLLNSFYYSNPKKTVTIKTLHNSRQLIIEDQGIGMSKETIEKLLKGPYRTIDSMKYHATGSGMGYQIIESILQQLGGSIDIESQIQVGTKVTIQWPSLT